MNAEINLPADCVLPCASKRVDELQVAIDFLEKRLSKLPRGSLYASTSHGKMQWQCLDNGVKRFLPASALARIEGLAQRKYFGLVLDCLRRQRDALDSLFRDYVPGDLGKIHASMKPEFRDVVSTLFPSQEEFVAAWKSVRFRGKSLEGSNLVSADGVKVRSKSELMIADALSGSGIPYRYEFPYKMNWRDDSGRVRQIKVHPDFTCLNTRTRQEVVWEHFGMMDDSGYAEDAIKKIDEYERNGFLLGENFVFTMETKAQPLNSRKIQAIIKRYLATLGR